MVGRLLLRGMLVGVCAGLLAFCFLKIVGEPAVDRAIAFESQMEAAAHAHEHAQGSEHGPAADEAEEPELVSRPVQAGLGLFTGVVVFGAALGGLFALVFAFAYGRAAALAPQPLAALLAATAFVAVFLVPNLKYPANPPSVGNPDTIGTRTALYFAMIALSVAAMIAAGMLRQRLLPRLGAWNAALAAAGAYIVLMIVAGVALPGVNEVPEAFPATLLWQFRIASLGAQAILWAVIGLGFGALAARKKIAVAYGVTAPSH